MSARRSKRKIEGLRWAKPCARPKCIPRSRPRGVRALGKRYEAAVAKQLTGKGVAGQWFEFEDDNGHGYCQIDFLLEEEKAVLEVKLTEVEAARQELTDLYLPVLRHIYGPNVRGIVVARHLTRETDLDRVCDSLPLALIVARTRGIPTLHWIGKGPL